MDDRLAVVRRDLDGRVRLAGGRAADEQRELEAESFHLAGDVHHLVERRRDESAEADEVRLFLPGPFENFLARHHHSHVDHPVVVTGEDDADDVLADVMDIAFDRGQDYAAGGVVFRQGAVAVSFSCSSRCFRSCPARRRTSSVASFSLRNFSMARSRLEESAANRSRCEMGVVSVFMEIILCCFEACFK